jgi:hypothetical protein
MKTVCLAVLAAFAVSSSPFVALAQEEEPTVGQPTERNGFNEQLNRLSATIDQRLADGRISHDDAIDAHREVNDIQAEAAEVRLRNGGRVPEGDHFGLQDRINKLREKIDDERIAAPPH